MERPIDERFISHEEFSNHDCHNSPHDGCQICYDFNRQQEMDAIEYDKRREEADERDRDLSEGWVPPGA